MRLFSFFLITVIFCFSQQAQAQKAFSYCHDAQHTGDILTCLSKGNEKAAVRLNNVYDQILKTQPEDKLEHFRSTQTEWLKYRDDECLWEAGQAETESLRRTKELSCLTALTLQRTSALEQFLPGAKAAKAADRLYESFPRWMNVVASENAGIFWRYSENLTADLDCDGQKEEIMQGRIVESKKVRLEGEPSHIIKHVISITENPVTGKPHSTLFMLDAADLSAAGEFCDLNAKLAVIDYPAGFKSEETAHCEKAVQFKAGQCAARTIFWGGQGYKLEPPPGK